MMALGSDQRSDDAPDRLYLARRPAGLGEDRSKRVLRCFGSRRRMEITLRFKFLVQLTDEPLQFPVGCWRLQLLGGWLGKVTLLRPLVGEQDHGLGKVERPKFRIDWDGHDCIGKRD